MFFFCKGIVFGGYINYAIFGSTYKSHWADRGWAGQFNFIIDKLT